VLTTSGEGKDRVHDHVVDELIWYLLQEYFCNFYLCHLNKFTEQNELNDVSRRMSAPAIFKNLGVGVEEVHLREVLVTDSDYNDADWQEGELNNEVERLLHVVQAAVCQEHKDVV